MGVLINKIFIWREKKNKSIEIILKDIRKSKDKYNI